MTVTTNEYGQQNMFAKETQPWISKTDAERYGYQTHAEKQALERTCAMMGILFGAISYASQVTYFSD